MTNPVILWRESFGYGNLTWSQVYLKIQNSGTASTVNPAGAATLNQWGRGLAGNVRWAMRQGTAGLRATTLGFSGAINTNGVSNNKVGVALAFNQGGSLGGQVMCEFWDDDQLGNGSFSAPLLHLSIETLPDGRLCARNGTGSGFGTLGTIIGTSTFVLPPGLDNAGGAFTHIEIKQPVIHASAGSVQVYANGTLALDLSGVSTRNAVGGSGKIGYVQPGTSRTNTGIIGDLIIHDCSGAGVIGDKCVGYFPASVAGTYTAGTATGAGTRLACVSEQAADGDTTYILEDDTALPKKVSFTCAALPANATSVDEVTEHIILRKSDASANTGRQLMKSGATEVDNGSDVSAPTGYNLFTLVGAAAGHQVDPHTSAAWTIPNCDAAEIGYDRTA